jgi:hypothetical protein
MTRTFIVSVQVTGVKLPTEEQVERMLAHGNIPLAFAGLGQVVSLKLLTWPQAEWTVEEVLQNEG